MSKEFEQISVKPGFMKHNGGLLFKTIRDNEYLFKTVINEKREFLISLVIRRKNSRKKDISYPTIRW